MPCITTHKIVSNKVLPRQLSNQKNTRTYTMMMQLKVVAVWVFLLVSTAGLTESKYRGPSLSPNIQFHVFLCMREADLFIQFGLTLWEVGVMGVDTLGDTSII